MRCLGGDLKRYLCCFSLHVSALQVLAVSDGMLCRTDGALLQAVAVKMTHGRGNEVLCL